jgi:hypothetical protein
VFDPRAMASLPVVLERMTRAADSIEVIEGSVLLLVHALTTDHQGAPHPRCDYCRQEEADRDEPTA